MKTKLFFLLINVVFVFNTEAQQSVQASLSGVSRLTPMIGFNTNAHVPANFPVKGNSGANWSQQWFIDSVGVLNPEILRFPGGTNANHWDWKTGWFVPPYAPTSTPLQIRTDEFKPGLMACNGKGLYVLNMETSNIQYEMDGLRHAAAIGLNPTLFELGNEHNLDGGTTYPIQFMTPTAYGQLAKTYYDSIKVEFPNSKVCVVGGNTRPQGITPTWNSDVLNLVPSIDAFAFHVYLDANNADLVFDINRALANPFGNVNNSNSLDYRYNVSGFGALPVDKEVWVTEFNLDEKQIASNYVISQTWTHTLYLTAMSHYFLTKPNITMILNHSLASSVSHYESISKVDGHFTANALAMKLLYDVSRGSNTCQNILFAGNPSMTYGNSTIPKLIGWKFNHVGNETGFICNFSSDSFDVSLGANFSNSLQYDQYVADPTLVVDGMSSLSKTFGISSDVITIAPYSITQIKSDNTLGVTSLISNNNNLDFVISAKNKNVTIDFNQTVHDLEVSVYNFAGQQVVNQTYVNGKNVNILVNSATQGFYILKLKIRDKVISKKIYID